MGTYSPAPVLTAGDVEAARARLIEPAFAGIAAEGAPYRGVLFCELMVTADGPEAGGVQRPLRRSGMPGADAAAGERPRALSAGRARPAAWRDLPAPTWRDEAAICVVLAAEGYPDAPQDRLGDRRAPRPTSARTWWSSTPARARRDDGALIAAGGRVLNVCALGADLHEARDARLRRRRARSTGPEGFHRTRHRLARPGRLKAQAALQARRLLTNVAAKNAIPRKRYGRRRPHRRADPRGAEHRHQGGRRKPPVRRGRPGRLDGRPTSRATRARWRCASSRAASPTRPTS